MPYRETLNSNLQTTIILSFVIFSFVLIALGSANYYYFQHVAQRTGMLLQKTEPLVIIGRIEQSIGNQQVSLLEHYLAREEAYTRNEMLQRIDGYSELIDEQLQRLYAAAETDRELQLVEDIAQTRKQYVLWRQYILELTAQGDYDAAQQVHAQEISPALLQYQESIERLFEYLNDVAIRAENDTKNIILEAQRSIYMFSIFGVFLAAFMSILLTRILKGIQRDKASLENQVFERQKAEDALRQITAGLEDTVRRRTNEIEHARELLEEELLERKKIEADLALSLEELKLANSELQEFAYVASHDLQEPLRKIRAFGDRLQSRYGEVLDEKGLDYLQRMKSAAERMANLIEALLELSRITTKARPFTTVDLNTIVADVINDLEIAIETHNVQLEVSALPTIEADPVQMTQLFQNLIGNAIKFQRPDTTPIIKIYSQPHEPKPGYWDIFVQDNGIGFDEKYAEKIFTVFQRLHGRQDFQGSGIGLAICRKIVTRHGGSMRAFSTPGKGSTFHIILPQESIESTIKLDDD